MTWTRPPAAWTGQSEAVCGQFAPRIVKPLAFRSLSKVSGRLSKVSGRLSEVAGRASGVSGRSSAVSRRSSRADAPPARAPAQLPPRPGVWYKRRSCVSSRC
jgi:hypothetical protein